MGGLARSEVVCGSFSEVTSSSNVSCLERTGDSPISEDKHS